MRGSTMPIGMYVYSVASKCGTRRGYERQYHAYRYVCVQCSQQVWDEEGL